MTKTEIDTETLTKELETHLRNQPEVSELIKRVSVSSYEDFYDEEVRCRVTIILKDPPPEDRRESMAYVGKHIRPIEDLIYKFFVGKFNYRTVYGLDPQQLPNNE